MEHPPGPSNGRSYRAITVFFMALFFFVLLAVVPILVSMNPTYFSGVREHAPILYRFITEYMEHGIPLLFSCTCGILGLILRWKTIHREATAMDSIDQIGIVGAIMGAISYSVIQSKVLLAIAYPKMNHQNIEAGFLGIMFFAILFGFFSDELVSYSRRKVIKSIQTPDSGSRKEQDTP